MQSRHRVSSVEWHVQLICGGTLCEDGHIHWELLKSKKRREGVELGTGLRSLREERVAPQHLGHDAAEDVGGERSGAPLVEERTAEKNLALLQAQSPVLPLPLAGRGEP
jgi:hypothetical protein